MTTAKTFTPDRWLVCSGAAFDSIAGFWNQEAGKDSLLQWRLDHDLIERTDLVLLPEYLTRLVGEDGGSISIVFENVDAAAQAAIDALPDLATQGLEIFIIDWRASPFGTVIGMNSPDRALLERLRQDWGATGTSVGHDPATDFTLDWTSFEKALMAWESGCRLSDEDGFAQHYPAFEAVPVPWRALALSTMHRRRHETPEPANDNTWMRVKELAASSLMENGGAFRLDAPSESPYRWSLTWAPNEGGPAGFLILQCHPSSANLLVGHRVRVKSGEVVFDLGEIQEDGIAEIRLEARPRDLSVSITHPDGA